MPAPYHVSLYHQGLFAGEKTCRINLRACRELLPDVDFEGWDDLPYPLLEERFEKYQKRGGTVDIAPGKDYKAGHINKQGLWVDEQMEILPTINNLPSKGVLKTITE